MPSERTEITEIVTGLGMLGIPSIDEAICLRPAAVTNVRDDQWERLEQLRTGEAHRPTFAAAWANGQAFAAARDGLRGRRPIVVEWKGPHGSVGDQVAPVDLRIDHVYLISCKYLSRILLNVAPASLFDNGLLGAYSRTRLDWYQEVAPLQYQALYQSMCAALDGAAELPRPVDELTTEHRRILKPLLKDDWPGESRAAYSELCFHVSAELGRPLARLAAHPPRPGGDALAVAAHQAARPTSCSAPARPARCGCASRRRGTGSRRSTCGRSTSGPIPSASRWCGGGRRC